jgi:uncharacterized protein YjlB
LDPEAEDDVLVDLKAGDAIVLPAGVAHCSRNTFSLMLFCGTICACCTRS